MQESSGCRCVGIARGVREGLGGLGGQFCLRVSESSRRSSDFVGSAFTGLCRGWRVGERPSPAGVWAGVLDRLWSLGESGGGFSGRAAACGRDRGP